jgi:uncharacterized SAM-binding protein YcdF (DUF218 family)
MGFVLKKIISTFLMPLPLGVLFILLGIFFLTKQKYRRAKYLLTFSVLWLFVFSYSPVVDTLLYQIESSYPTLKKAPQESKYIYLLGGGHNDDERLPITSQVSSESVVRLTEAIRLYRELENKPKIIVSGYSGPYSNTPHATMQNRLAQALGIPKTDIIISPEPQDTEEEAINAKNIIGSRKFILVTSAYHMKRSMIWFEKQGLHPTPAPTYHQATNKNYKYTDILSSHALMNSRVIFHEVLGMLWQKIKG